MITLHNSRMLFISSQVREFSAHYYSSSEIKGEKEGETSPFEKRCLRGGAAFRFLNGEESGAGWIWSSRRMGSQNTGALDQVGPLSRSRVVEGWFESKRFIVGWGLISKALALNSQGPFPPPRLPHCEADLIYCYLDFFVTYPIWLTNVKVYRRRSWQLHCALPVFCTKISQIRVFKFKIILGISQKRKCELACFHQLVWKE